jgi:hypothetical protein
VSASKIGQRPALGDENTLKLPFVRPKLSSSEISTSTRRVSGGYADLP